VGYKYLFSISDDLVPATTRQRADKVFVSFGGYDHRGLNHYLLQMIPKIVGPLRYDFAVGELGVGDINHLTACAQSVSRAANVEVNIHHRPVHYSRLLCESDLAVVSGGLTAFACAQAGIPSIAVPQYEHQLTNISNLAEIGCLRLGSREMRLDPNLLHNLVTELGNDYKARRQMNAAGRHAIDGKGLARTTQLIEAKYSGTACNADN
jgi:spore coat polysaccharide biosynthesis predicted glycosyltransferase SpsG